jgi:hypothetical protein
MEETTRNKQKTKTKKKKKQSIDSETKASDLFPWERWTVWTTLIDGEDAFKRDVAAFE